ncbi:hypothetical protein PIB30_046383 [Stylosanthes scabra]|uniref:Uncharacterized protein n=1 Tax=Stylosanthes scabra TaxID=79078 RepID=A0ABU6QG33_9FABA|nr:hypothetical protein [Stylosanthes scabra]
METQRVTKPSGVTLSPENLTRSSECASKSLSVRPMEAEITSGWFMLLVVCRISSEEKTIAGGGFPARGLGMTSTARYECLLHFAAFLDGGFPSSGIPPEIIAITRCVLRSLGSSLLLSALVFGLFCLCLTLRSSSLFLFLPVYSRNLLFFSPSSMKSRRSRHSSVSCPCCLWYLQYERRSPLLVFLWVLEPVPSRPEILRSGTGLGRR